MFETAKQYKGNCELTHNTGSMGHVCASQVLALAKAFRYQRAAYRLACCHDDEGNTDHRVLFKELEYKDKATAFYAKAIATDSGTDYEQTGGEDDS